MRTNYIAIIESPLQAWCFIEYCYYARIDIYKCAILLNINSSVSTLNLKIIENVFQYFDIEMKRLNLKKIDIISSRKIVFKRFKEVKLIVNEFYLKFDKSILIVGEFRSALAKSISNLIPLKNTIVLDDGNAIKRISSEKLNSFKDFVYYLLGVDFFSLIKKSLILAFF